MRPVDLVIESLYGGTIRDEAGVKENAGIVIRKILLLKALVDLLVQLMLVHGGKIEENRFCAIGGEFSSQRRSRRSRFAPIVLAPPPRSQATPDLSRPVRLTEGGALKRTFGEHTRPRV